MLTTTSEPLAGDNVKLTVTASADEVDKAITAAYAKIGGKIRVPGFRKGKAPRPVIDNIYGRPNVMAEATEQLVNDTYPRAIDAEELRPIESPDTGELETVEPGTEYTYEVEVSVRPELELESYQNIEVEVPPKDVTEADIDAQIDDLRERFGSLAPVEGRGVDAKDHVLVSFIGYVDGETYEGNQVDKYLYEMSRGLMPKAFDDGLLGMKPGEEKRIEFVVPETSSNQEFWGKTAQFDLTVHEIKATELAPLDDGFAQQIGFDTVEAMRDDIRKRLVTQKQYAWQHTKEKRAREEIARRTPGEIPEAMIEGRKRGLLQDFVHELEAKGTTIEAYTAATGTTTEDLNATVSADAEELIREDLALESLFRKLGMKVTEEDLDREFEEMGRATKETAEQARAKWTEMGLLPVIRDGVMRRKAVEWLMENVTEVVVDPSEARESTDAPEGTKPESDEA